ncbi:uncharacterized protein [Apostichopus japonicus]|uniref:uncharacterized protein isoform X2 n=1 Tax=Stichopus japonicus TaxID=307972 RepID=UPI003AB43D53
MMQITHGASSSVPGVQVEPQVTPKGKKGAQTRFITGIIQAFIATVLLISGMTVASVPGSPRDDIDKQVWPISVAAVLILNATFGILSRKNHKLIRLYLAFSIFACVLIAIAATPVITALLYSRNPSYYYYNSEHVDSSTEVHFVFYCIIVVCFIVELAVAIVVASYSCCVGDAIQTIVYYPAKILESHDNSASMNPSHNPGQVIPKIPRPTPYNGDSITYELPSETSVALPLYERHIP